MKTLDTIKVDSNTYNTKCKKCIFNNTDNSICVFVKCIGIEREDREYVYFRLVDMVGMDGKSE